MLRGFLLMWLIVSAVASSLGEVGRGRFRLEDVVKAAFAEALMGEEWPRVMLESVDVFKSGRPSSEVLFVLLGCFVGFEAFDEGRASSLLLECEDDDESASGASFVLDCAHGSGAASSAEDDSLEDEVELDDEDELATGFVTIRGFFFSWFSETDFSSASVDFALVLLLLGFFPDRSERGNDSANDSALGLDFRFGLG